MSALEILNEKVEEFSNGDVIVKMAKGSQGNLFIKIMSINKIDELHISENLDFNKCVMGDLESMLFHDNLLQLEEEVSSSTMVGFVTRPYQHNLCKYVKKKKVQEKEALSIFDEIVKGIYSLYLEEYLTRQVRSEHIVYSEGHWRLATLIFNHDNKSSGNQSEYLWSIKHEAPQCSNKSVFSDDEFEPMIVWNLGCILLEILLQNHKFHTREQMNKIKDRPFTFKGFGLSQKVWKQFSPEIEEVLQQMLMYDPKKRMPLTSLFSHQYLSPDVSKHFKINKPLNKSQKIVIGKSSVRMAKLNESTRLALHAVEKDLEARQQKLKETVRESNLKNVVAQEQFEQELGNLGQQSVHPNKFAPHQFQKKIDNPYTPVEQSIPAQKPSSPVEEPIKKEKEFPKKEREPESIEQMMKGQNQNIQEALYLYKSFYDQSQLLNKSLQVISEMKFPQMKQKEVEELHLLIDYSVSLVSLINLNALSEGLNRNANILELEADLFTAFAGSSQCSNFKKFANILKDERSENLEEIKSKITMLKEKPLISANPFILNMLKVNYKATNFKDIKIAYRFIVKHAYDRISEQYNINKNNEQADALARIAMYVTYCLTIDKLYIKEDIGDNFKFFFEWAHKPESNLVPLNEFKKYLDTAPKKTLIKNSRYILKKYYDT